MTLEEKQQQLIDKYTPILIEAGFVNPVIRFDINLMQGLTEDSIIINYTSIVKTSVNWRKFYVGANLGNTIFLQIQGDIINKIFNELVTFSWNQNLNTEI
jgi:hypothetical protein